MQLVAALIGCGGAIIGALIMAWATYEAAQRGQGNEINQTNEGESPAPNVQPTASNSLVAFDTNPAQRVRWAPLDGYPAGICIETCALFVPWSALKPELEDRLLPQVGQVGLEATLELRNLGSRRDWIVAVVDTRGVVVANVWLGSDPQRDWIFDGRVRIGPPNLGGGVWATFERRSDGSYRRL
ncbi:MAG TPA: hypothetical protein VFS60_11145 [Thermoanaerobaculia bacterium]|nr:hypothetical protein [Thermoanaerobaculia bacterium]